MQKERCTPEKENKHSLNTILLLNTLYIAHIACTTAFIFLFSSAISEFLGLPKNCILLDNFNFPSATLVSIYFFTRFNMHFDPHFHQRAIASNTSEQGETPHTITTQRIQPRLLNIQNQSLFPDRFQL